jgi:ferric-dicitrate binding protein FerR (iron transport regulator)
LQGKASTNVIPLSKKLRRWHVAATILLTLALGIWWVVSKQDKPQWVEVKTGGKEKREVVLPDSSHVWLNENSALVFDRRFTKRQVTLDGEAYFDVQRLEESPFEILSGDATTTVLGTAFNVRAYPAEDFIEVTVEEGKVALSANREKKSPVILTAGMSGIFNKKEKNAEAAAEKIVNADAWKTGELRFDETPVKEIIQSLERYFGIDIDVTDPLILNCQYTVGFGQPQLPQALEVIAAGLSLHLERSGDRYLLSGEGCQNQ